MSVLVRVASTLSADALAMSVALLAILRNARLFAERTLAGESRVAGIALTIATNTLSVSSAKFSIMTRTIEIVAFAELSAYNLVGILKKCDRVFV